MKILREINLDLEKEKARIHEEGIYTLNEQGKLLHLVSQIERGLFQAAWENVKEWEREEREYVSQEIWDFLAEIEWGTVYRLPE